MATRNGRARPSAASRQAEQERTDREDNAQITAAVAATEREINDSIFDDDALEMDGDNSLEEMGDGLEGDDNIDDDVDDEEVEGADQGGEEGDGEDEGEDDGELDEPEGDELDGDGGDDDGGEELPLAAEGDDQGQQPRRGIPPGRLREETATRRALEAELIEMRGRMAALTDMVTGRTQPQQQQQREEPQPEPEPDQFAYPEQWREWNRRETARLIAEGVREGLRTIQAQTQETVNARANESLDEAANGPRGWEFKAAYDKLRSLAGKPEYPKLVNKILHAPDPAAEVFNWWERNGGPEYREAVAQQLAEINGWELPAPQQHDRGNGRQVPQREVSRDRSQNGQQPRQVFRGPRPMRSLNGVPGGVRQQIDPRALDDSDASVAAYVFSN